MASKIYLEPRFKKQPTLPVLPWHQRLTKADWVALGALVAGLLLCIWVLYVALLSSPTSSLLGAAAFGLFIAGFTVTSEHSYKESRLSFIVFSLTLVSIALMFGILGVGLELEIAQNQVKAHQTAVSSSGSSPGLYQLKPAGPVQVWLGLWAKVSFGLLALMGVVLHSYWKGDYNKWQEYFARETVRKLLRAPSDNLKGREWRLLDLAAHSEIPGLSAQEIADAGIKSKAVES